MFKIPQLPVCMICMLIILNGCNSNKKNDKDSQNLEKFGQELIELKEYFKIPGMAVLVKKDGQIIYEEYLGKSDVKNTVPVDASTVFPIASLTKVFTGIAMMKHVEEGELSLDKPLSKYFPDLQFDDSINLAHVLSHTSQGRPGENFYYSTRFGILTKVIEKASSISFKQYIEEKIINKLSLKHTFLLQDSTQLKGIKIAKPYLLKEGIQDGFIDYGFSASAGIISTARDLSKLDSALDNNTLVSKASKNKMFTSFKPGLPYGYGIFSQDFENKKLIWAYGQYDCYSSLYLKIPEDNLTLILLANNNLMSDPARLIYGNISSSLFAISFLKNIALGYDNLSLFESEETLQQDSKISTFKREKMLAQALAASFMSRLDLKEMESSKRILKKVFKDYPNYQEYGDLSLLHNLMFLKEVAFHREIGEFNDFDVQIEIIGKNSLQTDPDNPYANYYLGSFYDKSGSIEQAKKYFERIVNAKNFSPNWYTKEAELWLQSNK